MIKVSDLDKAKELATTFKLLQQVKAESTDENNTSIVIQTAGGANNFRFPYKDLTEAERRGISDILQHRLEEVKKELAELGVEC